MRQTMGIAAHAVPPIRSLPPGRCALILKLPIETPLAERALDDGVANLAFRIDDDGAATEDLRLEPRLGIDQFAALRHFGDQVEQQLTVRTDAPCRPNRVDH